MGKRFDFEYIVVGGGSAGTTAALELAKNKRKVALIEQDKWGGAGTSSRDVPGKALFNFSHLYAQAISGSRFGLSSGNLRYNYPTALHWRDTAIAKATPKKKDLGAAGITCLRGKAHFISPNDISVGDGQFSANKFILATGSEPNLKKISGTDTVHFLTPATALKIERPPKAALIVGGGASGLEIAEYYSELGAKVVVLESKSRLLPKEDPEIGKFMEQYFTKRLGIKVFTGTRVVALEQAKNASKVVFMRNGQERALQVGTIVLATGSTPYLDCGLQNAHVNFDDAGVVVDKTLHTSARNIYAAGDVIGGDSSTEKAIYTAEVAVRNLLERNKTYVNFDGLIRIVETNPQIAIVGLTERELQKSKKKYKKALVPLTSVQASVTSDFRVGFFKLLADSQGKVLGAAAICPEAPEIMQEIALAIKHGLPLIQIASTPHPVGSWSELVHVAAKQIFAKK